MRDILREQREIEQRLRELSVLDEDVRRLDDDDEDDGVLTSGSAENIEMNVVEKKDTKREEEMTVEVVEKKDTKREEEMTIEDTDPNELRILKKVKMSKEQETLQFSAEDVGSNIQIFLHRFNRMVPGTWCSSAKRENLNDPTLSWYHENVKYLLTRVICFVFEFSSPSSVSLYLGYAIDRHDTHLYH